MQSSINRYLRESNYEYSILKGKACLLREKGLGKKPNKTNSLTRQEEDILWKYGKLGAKTPESIIATLSWQLTQHFGLRDRQDHHSMRVEGFSFRQDGAGALYIVFAEEITKTRQRGPHQKIRLQLANVSNTV